MSRAKPRPEKDILHLTLHRMWFNAIAMGIKKEEFREIKEYWIRILIDNKTHHPKRFDEILFKNGYAPNCPFMRVEWCGLLWKPYEGKIRFAIQLGSILEIRNWKQPDPAVSVSQAHL